MKFQLFKVRKRQGLLNKVIQPFCGDNTVRIDIFTDHLMHGFNRPR